MVAKEKQKHWKHHKTRGSTLISGFFEIHICKLLPHWPICTKNLPNIGEFSEQIQYINTNLQLGKNGFCPVDTSFEWRCLLDDGSIWETIRQIAIFEIFWGCQTINNQARNGDE